MKKFVFLITIIALVLSLDFMGYKINEFIKSSDSYVVKKNIKKAKAKINELDTKIKEDNQKVKEVEESNIDKVRLLDVWKKELEKTNR